MIDVEIRGPVAKKEFEYLKNILEKSGEHLYREKRAIVLFMGEYPNGFVDLEISSGKDAQIVQKDHRTKTENIIPAQGVSFKTLVSFCTALGYTKGTVTVRDVLCAKYGGAYFTLVDPLENDALYYEATISVKDPTSSKEAKKKLESLARKFKLPIWGTQEMISFFERLNKQSSYTYDAKIHGEDHFAERFGI